MLHLRERNIYMTESFLLFTNSSIFFKILFKMFEPSPCMAICKPRYWSLGNGIGIGNGTDTTNVIISSYIRLMGNKPSRVMTYDEGTPPTKSRDTSISWSRDK